MSKSAVPIAAPKTLRYEQDAGLPVAIEARSNRRSFYPSNGNIFSPTGTNVLRMTLNSNSFLDFSHSYLQFTLLNNSGHRLQTDLGVPFFSRLQIMSGGQELEDIQEWSRLYATLLCAQGSVLNADENSLTQHGKNTEYIADDAEWTTTAPTDAELNAAMDRRNPNIHKPAPGAAAVGTFGTIQNGDSRTYNVPLMSGIFNIEKYFPLLLTDQGLDLYFTLNSAVEIGVWDNAAAGYQINNVKYVAHEVNLDDSFVNQMKASMQATGGLLSLSSTTYRYYQLQGTTVGQEDHNISCRVKSLKGMIVRPQRGDLQNTHDKFAISTSTPLGINEAQFRIGSVLYPQESIKFSNDNKGELFQEIRKCFGTIGSYNHGTMLNDETLIQEADERLATGGGAPGGAIAGTGGTKRQHFMIAYDFETFAKSATESGINVSDRALPVTLTLKKTGVANQMQAGRHDVWAMCDCIIYIDLMGKISTRI